MKEHVRLDLKFIDRGAAECPKCGTSLHWDFAVSHKVSYHPILHLPGGVENDIKNMIRIDCGLCNYTWYVRANDSEDQDLQNTR